MHQPSVPTWNYGAPPVPTLPRPSRRGRCAVCTAPVYDDQDARQIVVDVAHYAGGTTRPAPYRHKEC